MNFSKKLFLLFSILFFTPQAWAMDSPDEYGSPEWLQKFTKYSEQKGRQKQRLESEKEYTHSCVRFVKDIPNLTVGYGLLSKDQHPAIPGLQLHPAIYQELAEIGTAVKIINGYIQVYDDNSKILSFTPKTTNVFVPHISYVIQWEGRHVPELVPGGMIHDSKGHAMVFMSGNPADGDSVEKFYNHIYKAEKAPAITIYSEQTAKNEIKNSIRTGINSSHTEPLFIELIKTKPKLLTQGLGEIISDKKEMSEKPKFLGFIIDSFSWLDVCADCSKDLNNNLLWSESLELITSDDTIQHFDLPPNNKIDSLFRIVAQEPYDKGPPDISKAEGGKDYTASGWDYRVLSEMRYTLATRTSPKESQLWRDRIFEKIPTAVTKAALTQSIEVWKQYYAHWPLTQGRPFAGNIIDILFLRFPDHQVMKIIKIDRARKNSNFEEVYQLAEPLLTQEFDDTDKTLLSIFGSETCRNPQSYVKKYYDEACQKRVRDQIK